MFKKATVDFHLHSDFSDGDRSPEEVVEQLAAKGIRIAALTDHDTLKGVDRFMRAAKKRGIFAVPGVEVSTVYENCDVHILGINVRHNLHGAEELFESNNEKRIIITRDAYERLRRENLISISMEELSKHYRYPGKCVTLLHAMDYMVKFEGHSFDSAREAVMRIWGEETKEKRPKFIPTSNGIEAILKLGGVPILAHPGELERQIVGDRIRKREVLISILVEFKKMGLVGLEAFHSKHSKDEEKDYVAIAKYLGLKVSAGSDYHGSHKLIQEVGRHGVNYQEALGIFQ